MMQTEPARLGIVIPVFNAARTVGDTIASLQEIEDGWSFVDQVLICDDASTDGSIDIVRETRFDRCPLRILRHDANRGEAASYATMVSELSPDVEWFLILHSDDLALQNFIVRNLEIIAQCDEKVASVASNFYVFDDEHERLAAVARDLILFRAGTDENIRHTALEGCWWHISGALVNRTLWTSFGGRNPRLPCAGDWDLVLRWQSEGYTVGYSLVPTTKYRQWTSTSLSSSDYPVGRDLKERTEVALGLPHVFCGTLRLRVAGRILRDSLRRCVKWMVSGDWILAARAFRIGAVAFWKLLVGSHQSIEPGGRRR